MNLFSIIKTKYKQRCSVYHENARKIYSSFPKGFKQSIASLINLETADNATTLVSIDGSLISYVKIQGSKQIIGDEEYNKIIEASTIKIGARFDRQGHAMQVFFARDPNRIRKELETLVRPSRITAESCGLEMDDLFSERIAHLERFLTHEECYFVLWTRPTVLTKSEHERSSKEAKERAKEWLNAGQAQYPFAALDPLRTRHKSFITSVLSALNELGIGAELLKYTKPFAIFAATCSPIARMKTGAPVCPAIRYRPGRRQAV